MRREHPVQRQELAAYVQFCRDNLRALLTGALPTYYLNTLTDAERTAFMLDHDTFWI